MDQTISDKSRFPAELMFLNFRPTPGIAGCYFTGAVTGGSAKKLCDPRFIPPSPCKRDGATINIREVYYYDSQAPKSIRTQTRRRDGTLEQTPVLFRQQTLWNGTSQA
jgi:hypothetical protein